MLYIIFSEKGKCKGDKMEKDVIVDIKRKNKEKKDAIIGILFLIWFFISIGAMVYFSGTEQNNYTIMIFGQYFFIFAFFPLIKGTIKSKLILGIPFLLIGACMIVIPLCIMNPQWFKEEINWENIIIRLTILSFILAGLIMLIAPVIERRRMEKLCTEIVDATVIKHQVKLSDGGRVYCPVYKFNYYNEDYEVSDNTFSNFGIEPVATQVQIKINPDNPNEFLRPTNTNSYFIQFIGILFLIALLPIFIGMFI